MTCIAGVVDGKDVWLGGDGQASTSYTKIRLAQPKVFRRGPFLFGCSGSGRVVDVVRYRFKPPKHKGSASVEEYMRVAFVNKLRRCSGAAGRRKKDDGVETMPEATVLVGYAGRLFTVYETFSVGETSDGFCVIGCGQEVALGSLGTTEAYDIPPRERVMIALRCAARFSVGVGPPFKVLQLRG